MEELDEPLFTLRPAPREHWDSQVQGLCVHGSLEEVLEDFLPGPSLPVQPSQRWLAMWQHPCPAFSSQGNLRASG